MEITTAVPTVSNVFARQPRPNRSEEPELVARARRHDRQAVDRLMRAHFPLVVHVAREFWNRGVAADDLVGEGCVGLLKAIQRFDPAKGAKFTTYASFWVRREMLNAIVDQPWTVHVPRYARQNGKSFPREIRIEAEIAGAGGLRIADRLIDRNAVSPVRRMMARQEREFVRRHVLALEPRERAVLVARFGLDGEAPRSLQEIGREMTLSRERIRQIEVAVLNRLRKAFRRPARRRSANSGSDDRAGSRSLPAGI